MSHFFVIHFFEPFFCDSFFWSIASSKKELACVATFFWRKTSLHSAPPSRNILWYKYSLFKILIPPHCLSRLPSLLLSLDHSFGSTIPNFSIFKKHLILYQNHSEEQKELFPISRNILWYKYSLFEILIPPFTAWAVCLHFYFHLITPLPTKPFASFHHGSSSSSSSSATSFVSATSVDIMPFPKRTNFLLLHYSKLLILSVSRQRTKIENNVILENKKNPLMKLNKFGVQDVFCDTKKSESIKWHWNDHFNNMLHFSRSVTYYIEMKIIVLWRTIAIGRKKCWTNRKPFQTNSRRQQTSRMRTHNDITLKWDHWKGLRSVTLRWKSINNNNINYDYDDEHFKDD